MEVIRWTAVALAPFVRPFHVLPVPEACPLPEAAGIRHCVSKHDSDIRNQHLAVWPFPSLPWILLTGGRDHGSEEPSGPRRSWVRTLHSTPPPIVSVRIVITGEIGGQPRDPSQFNLVVSSDLGRGNILPTYTRCDGRADGKDSRLELGCHGMTSAPIRHPGMSEDAEKACRNASRRLGAPRFGDDRTSRTVKGGAVSRLFKVKVSETQPKITVRPALFGSTPKVAFLNLWAIQRSTKTG
ncbi:hypothetical protein B0I37DRAFT_142824 [Chaetomium sp. MPI-CAGE-AT-0009]|nr:hypothetical protein B0I37DRAFT_142824 [Chaetomium sp. MPI-CAGE-AT-0009]